jgi:nucleotide-binding universal stress UspA family protein
MGFKDILLISSDPRPMAALPLAVALAASEGAHLTALSLTPTISMFVGGLPYSGSISEVQTLEALEAEARQKALAEARKAESQFRAAAERQGVSAEWRHAEGDMARIAVLHTRYADLAVIGQSDPDHPVRGAASLVEAILLGAGRPVLVVPYAGAFAAVGRNVLLCFNATREAARALNDALPILARADKVTVFSVNPPDAESGGPAVPGADIALHLARHGVKAEAASTVSLDIDVGNTILSRASDFSADLIVMGGYGHSRQREFIMGGATRTLLRHMTVPVLLSH